ncbi:MAG: hypothetical protein IPM92_05095 [Saprospiraceae bacterium]|nr:hypothetical protein [Saprospiraceae bacterium]
MMQYRILTLILSFHILVAQLGLNVFMLYCCCTKKVEYSFIPKEDQCVKKHPAKSCHTKIKTCTVSHSHKKPCENQLVEYKALDFTAEKPTKEIFSDFSLTLVLNQNLSLANIEFANVSTTHFVSYTPYKTGVQRLIQYCLHLC